MQFELDDDNAIWNLLHNQTTLHNFERNTDLTTDSEKATKPFLAYYELA